MIAFTDITEGYLETFLPGTPKNFKPAVNSHKYKAVSSVENELCLFPIDTSDEVCLCIALEIAHNRCTDWVAHCFGNYAYCIYNMSNIKKSE